MTQLQRKIEYCRTGRANNQEIPSAAAFFPDLAGSAVEMKLLLDPKTADDRAAGWRQDSEWQEHPERLFQKLITLLPPDGVKKDVVKQLIAVDLEDSIENATVAYSYMTRMQLVLQEHGYHTGGLRAFPIDQATLALKGIKHQLKSSPSAFLNTVGTEVFDNITDYGDKPTTLWEFAGTSLRKQAGGIPVQSFAGNTQSGGGQPGQIHAG